MFMKRQGECDWYLSTFFLFLLGVNFVNSFLSIRAESLTYVGECKTIVTEYEVLIFVPIMYQFCTNL